MKYKLIHSQTKEEHLCDKITIDGFDYYVSDEEINNGNWVLSDKSISPIFLDGGDLYPQILDLNQWCKVIATNNPNIDIPKVVDEVDSIKKNLYFFKQVMNPYETGSQSYTAYEKGFIEGYNKSQETHSFSEGDTIEFAEWVDNNSYFQSPTKDGKWFFNDFKDMDKEATLIASNTKELFQLWKKQRIKTVYYE